jgi:uncharacterized membrane protein YfcA
VDLLTPFAVLVVGFGSGVLSGMFGVGGSVLTTPGIRALGATPIEAIGSTIPAMLPGAMSGAVRYARAGLVDWRIALTCGGVGSMFAVVGANASNEANAHFLLLLTAGLLLWSGLSNLRTPRSQRVVAMVGGGAVDSGVRLDDIDDPDLEPEHPIGLIAAIGACSGFLAGLLGVGGGVVMVPAFTGLLKVPAKKAVAASLVSVAMFSVPAMIRHAQLGHISWIYAMLLMVGVIPGAQAGAHFTIRGSEQRLRMLMGALFTVLALGYGAAELHAL